MPPQKAVRKKPSPKSFEETLWISANPALHGSVESSNWGEAPKTTRQNSPQTERDGANQNKHDYVLTPGRYVGAAALEDDGIPFETKMTELSQTLYAQMEESAKLDEVIRKNLEGLGYGK